jgi:hypothetical protein
MMVQIISGLDDCTVNYSGGCYCFFPVMAAVCHSADNLVRLGHAIDGDRFVYCYLQPVLDEQLYGARSVVPLSSRRSFRVGLDDDRVSGIGIQLTAE